MTLDTELDVDALRELTRRFQALYDFPQNPREQLDQAIEAVFDSWMGERAVAYRRINGIPDDWGTAVNVQQMVYGNKGQTSASGVAFSRDEVTGAPEPSGDFLVDAQGEDVVSGVRTPRDLHELGDWMPAGPGPAVGDPAQARAPLQGHAGHRVHDRGRAPVHAADAQRQAPGPGRRALRGRRRRGGAADARRGDRDDRRRLARRAAAPDVRAGAQYEVVARGVAASPGAAKGAIVFTAPDAVAAAAGGPRRDPRAPVHRGRRRRRLPRRQGHPHVRGRQGVARRARRARHGPPGGHRRRRPRDRPARPRGPRRRARSARGRPDRDRRHDRPDHARRRAARHPARGRALRDRAAAGATSCARWACARTPTRPRTPAARASSAPRASGSAAPSTCSWPPTASRRCSG